MRFSVLFLGMLLPSAAAADEFSETWYDGRAELSGYDLKIMRYGEERTGCAVLVYVTEPFSASERVKADTQELDTINVLKLNLVRDFQTGLYDYNTMVSVFTDDTSLDLKKISFSSAEWCGHVYEEQIVNPDLINRTVHSYFQGESGTKHIANRKGGLLEDELFVLLRSLRGEFLPPGESLVMPFLTGPFFSRVTHKEPEWTTATITRRADSESLTVPAGKFRVHVYDVALEGDREGTFWIEDAYPHRIIGWKLFPDVDARLTGSTRLPYWELHDNGHERYLKELGLEKRN